MAIPRLTLFRLRQRSLARGVLLALAAMGASLLLAGFPHAEALRHSPWQILLTPVVIWAMLETFRCLGRTWTLYYAGILLLLYSELMILALVLFLWIYL
jgi:hypothetical protein